MLGINRGTFRSWASRHAAQLPVRERGPRRTARYRWGDVCAILPTLRDNRVGR